VKTNPTKTSPADNTNLERNSRFAGGTGANNENSDVNDRVNPVRIAIE